MGTGTPVRIAVRATLVAALLTGLAACEDGALTSGKNKSAMQTSSPAGTIELVERDVEAPEVFEVNTAALWDGRPSLGGVWVAHADSKQPERVFIRNQANGKFVIGALFRRERNNPGPDLQLSSDAAAALGVLAGTPTKLQVTALRRETVNVAEPKQAAPDETKAAPAETVATAELAPTPTETLEAKVLASVKAAETKSVLKPKPKPAAKAKKAAEAKTAAKAKPTAKPKPVAKAKPVAKTKISQPYVQIGFFSIESNATSNVAKMKSNGIPAKTVEATAKGKTFWRVLAGPAGSKAEKKQLLTMVKKLGFNDAYFVNK